MSGPLASRYCARRRYLVTGGCGFIGSHLCDRLLERGDEVRVLDDLSTGSLANLPAGAVLIEGDIRDEAALALAMEGCNGTFHLAAIASVERGRREWVGTHAINQTGTIKVLEAARRAGFAGSAIPVVYASSAAVYGDQGDAAAAETALPVPISAYGADKLGCEHHARVASLVHGVPTVGLRFFNVYGPRQDPASPYSGVISIFCDRIAGELPITVFGDGWQTRDFVYVGDVVTGLVAAMDRVSERPAVFNICTGNKTSVADLIRTVGALCDVKPLVTRRPPRSGEIRHSLGDPSAAKRWLGFEARTPLSQGLAITMRTGRKEPVHVPD